ncbi:hypothetical protein D3C78_1779860 [compost metagenome]
MVFQYTAHYHICDAYHRAANIQMGFSHAAYTCTLNTFDASYSFAKGRDCSVDSILHVCISDRCCVDSLRD